MEFKEVSGVKLPVLGIGTYRLGNRPDPIEDTRCIRAIKFAIDRGMTHIDTAEVYGYGHTEELVGQAMKGVTRSEVFITTKVSPNNLHYEDVVKSCQASLTRLGTDYVDLYLIHGPNPDIPMDETMRAMNRLVETGLTRFIGVSNFEFAWALKYAQQASPVKLVATQEAYNLTADTFQARLDSLPFCQENDMFLIAHSPLDVGKIARSKNPVLAGVAKRYGKTRAQVALNYLISQDNVVTIPRATDRRHILGNLGALGWRMDQEDIDILNEAYIVTL